MLLIVQTWGSKSHWWVSSYIRRSIGFSSIPIFTTIWAADAYSSKWYDDLQDIIFQIDDKLPIFVFCSLCLPAGGFGAANICLRPAGTLLDLDFEDVADFI